MKFEPNHEHLLHKEEDGNFFLNRGRACVGLAFQNFTCDLCLRLLVGHRRVGILGSEQIRHPYIDVRTHTKTHSSPATHREPMYGTTLRRQQPQQARPDFPAHITPSVSGGKVATMSPYTMHGQHNLSTDISSGRVGRGKRVKLRQEAHVNVDDLCTIHAHSSLQ